MTAPGWPARLTAGAVTLRPIRRSDGRAWRALRLGAEAWLGPWEAMTPSLALTPWGQRQTLAAWYETTSRMRREARRGAALPLAVEVDGEFAGQVAVTEITRGAGLSGSLGYWLGEAYAGRGVGLLAVRLLVRHSFDVAGLHRLEAYVREENLRSRKLLSTLGFRLEGTAVGVLFVEGAWRDHLVYALTREEAARERRLDIPPG